MNMYIQSDEQFNERMTVSIYVVSFEKTVVAERFHTETRDINWAVMWYQWQSSCSCKLKNILFNHLQGTLLA